MKQIRRLIDAVKTSPDDALTKKANDFGELNTRELKTQWKHKISVIPEAEGITTRWWDFGNGTIRDEAEAQLPSDQAFIRTKQSGEYIVGVPALGGMATRVEGTPQSTSDDFWAGYTNRLEDTTLDDGVGIGVSYFNKGDGDNGGALQDGVQEYVWFKSGITGVPDKRVPRDQWNGEDIDDIARDKGEILKAGGFERNKFTFYNQGNVNVNWGFKKDDGTLEVRTIHSFNVPNKPMWSQSDLHMEAQVLGSNLTGYVNAAHFKAGQRDLTIRENGETRAPPVTGNDITVNAGDARPVISLQLRDGWENVNIQPVGLSLEMDDSFIVFITVGPDLVGANFDAPNTDITGVTPTGSEYAANADNEATDFNSIGEIEFITFVEGSQTGNQSSQVSDTIPDFSLSNGEIATLGVVPVGATNFEGASFRWGANF